jgi:hypothetical protein
MLKTTPSIVTQESAVVSRTKDGEVDNDYVGAFVSVAGRSNRKSHPMRCEIDYLLGGANDGNWKVRRYCQSGAFFSIVFSAIKMYLNKRQGWWLSGNKVSGLGLCSHLKLLQGAGCCGRCSS